MTAARCFRSLAKLSQKPAPSLPGSQSAALRRRSASARGWAIAAAGLFAAPGAWAQDPTPANSMGIVIFQAIAAALFLLAAVVVLAKAAMVFLRRKKEPTKFRLGSIVGMCVAAVALFGLFALFQRVDFSGGEPAAASTVDAALEASGASPASAAAAGADRAGSGASAAAAASQAASSSGAPREKGKSGSHAGRPAHPRHSHSAPAAGANAAPGGSGRATPNDRGFSQP